MNQDTTEATALEALDIRQIMETLPHRYPFLLVDRIERIVGDQSCVGIKNVTMNEPFFQGHFPGRPIMPGVLLLEGMAQTAGVICARTYGAGPVRMTYFLTIDKAKFRRPVVPGDRVEFHMTKITQRRSMWWFHGDAKVDGQIVCQADIGAMIAEE
ncbi:MAG TPA: 3-hydroxyacyl-ACP dehydratase FabZ [Xanthobacteraceae bacterium]|nr:3-hydroxyacyl-ACP dehydratase FabZ [Xanthobacteraceae bacterium]